MTRRLSVKEYADLAGLTREAVYHQIKTSTLPPEVTAERYSNAWILAIPEGFRPERRKPGPKPGR